VQFNSATIEFRNGRGLKTLHFRVHENMCISYGEDENITTFVAELLMNIYFLPGSGDNMDLRSLLDWVSLISLVDFYTYCTKYKILPSPSCSAIVLRHDSIANIQHW